jgi:hypothetical protein
MATRVKMSPEEVKAIKDALARRSASTDEGRPSANGMVEDSAERSEAERSGERLSSG